MTWLFTRALRRFVLLAGAASLLLNLMALAPSLFMLQVFDRVFSSSSLETLTMLGLIVALALVVMWVMDRLRAITLAWAGAVLDRKLGPEVLGALLRASAQPGGARNQHTLRDVGLLRNVLGGGAILAVFDAPWLPLYVALIFAFDPAMGWFTLGGAVLLFGLILLNERLTNGPIQATTTAGRNAARFIDAALRNAEVIAGMGMGRAVVTRWQAHNDEVLEAQMRLSRRQATLQASVRLLRQGLQAGMVGLGAWLVIQQHASPGIMVAATILLGKALSPVEQLVGGWKSLVEARAAWARLSAEPLQAHGASVELPPPEGKLDVERIVYALPGQRVAVIKGVAFSLPAGACLGIIGPSGSGKTTLLRLMLGIWQAQSGTVRLDGADLGRLDADHLARHVGYLPQDVELFAGSVAENIARMQTAGDGSVDSQAVVEAARQAGVHELVLRLPDGYETRIGDGGAGLSGGQRQRIALARALYGNPRLVVLDEPNSNLDADGEAALLQALAGLRERGCTVVMVGHRPSAMRAVDTLAVIRDGTLDAFGPRDQVLAKLGQAPVALQAVAPRAA
jgi:PrtD family type I secretion system ABC transporter